MKKDHMYYQDRVFEEANRKHDALIKDKTREEAHAMIDELNAESGLERVVRIRRHLNEAFAIIRALIGDPEPGDPEKQYDIMWVDGFSERMGKGELMTRSATRQALLDRLHWISSEEFGEDLCEWIDWMAAFEAHPPPWGYR